LSLIPLHGEEIINKYLPNWNCFQISFLQRNYFEGEIETYRGYLIKDKTLKVLYQTEPPFVVEMDNKTVKIGYKGENFQIFDRKEYKNPILEVLFNLNRLGNYFKVVSEKGNFLILKPKKELKNYITDVKVEVLNGTFKYLKVENGEENYTEIYIEKIVPCGGNLKLNSRNGR
jgi:hypothetical protein